MQTLIRSKLIWGLLLGAAIGYADGRANDEIRHDGQSCEATVNGLWYGAGLGLLAGIVVDALPKRKAAS
jgi:hypothetical protein